MSLRTGCCNVCCSWSHGVSKMNDVFFQNSGFSSFFFTAKFKQLSVYKSETSCRINNSVMEEDGIRITVLWRKMELR